MSELINEFFDEIERFFPAFILFVVFSAIGNFIWSYAFDISSLTADNFQEKIKEIVIENRFKVILVWLLTFSINLFSLMGLWKCIVGRCSGLSDFFKGGISLFFSGFLPYLAINIYPVFVTILFFFLSKTSRYLASLIGLLLIICSVWLWIRISFWQPLISMGNGGFEAVRLSFLATRNNAYLVFWFLIFPYAVFYNLGANVTWPFLVYAFAFFNSTFLPASIEVIRYMVYKRISVVGMQRTSSSNLYN